MVDKLTALLLSLLALVQTLFPAALGAKTENYDANALSDVQSVADYVDHVQTYGAPAMDTGTFLKMMTPLEMFRRLKNGKLLSEDEENFIDMTMDETLSEMCGYIAENTGLDIEDFMGHLPKKGSPLGDALSEAIPVDPASVREKMYGVGDKAREEGYTLLASAIYIFAMYFTAAEKLEVYSVPLADDPDVVQVLLDVTYRDGTKETVDPDIVVNTQTGHAYNIYGTGMAGSGFEIDIYDLTLYTIVRSWQRKYGFGLLYDLFSDSNPAFVYTTRRFKFDHAGKSWMLQIWKGNYALITNGGEIGIYNRDADKTGTFYNSVSDDEMLTMQMDIYHNGELLVSRGPETTWWLTAFKLGKTLYLPDSLTMEFSVTVKDKEMLDALLAAIDAEAAHDVSYTVDGLTVHGVW